MHGEGRCRKPWGAAAGLAGKWVSPIAPIAVHGEARCRKPWAMAAGMAGTCAGDVGVPDWSDVGAGTWVSPIAVPRLPSPIAERLRHLVRQKLTVLRFDP